MGAKRGLDALRNISRSRLLQFAGTAHDIGMAAISLYAAFAIVVGFDQLRAVPGIHDKVLLFTLISATSFFFASLNRGSWRYASIHDLFAILRGSFIAVVAFTVILFLLSRGDNLPRSVLLLSFIFMVCLLSGSRLAYRVLKENGYVSLANDKGDRKHVRNVLLIGAGANAESFVRAIRRSESTAIRVAGIIDDRQNRGSKIQGIEVLGNEQAIGQALTKLDRKGRKVSEIVVTDYQLDRGKIGELVSMASKWGVEVTRIPDLSATSQLRSDLPVTKPIELSDLLGRPEVVFDTSPVARLIQAKTILVTGAGGSIGSEIARQIAPFAPDRVIITDISEFLLHTAVSEISERFPELDVVAKIADIRDRTRIDGLMAEFVPDVVFHAAALKHVPLMENNVLESIKTNVLGTRNLAQCAVRYGVKTFVMISTDKAVNPTSVMGATKRAAEAVCQALDVGNHATRFKTVRFGNVLGSHGSVVPRFERQIAKGGPVTVTHPDIVRYFMTIPEAVRLVLQASGHGMRRSEDRGGILVLEMGEPVRVADLAVRMIELAGLQPGEDIAIEYTGLRPGEKLYEELLAPSEEDGMRREEGYVLAFPRTVPADILTPAIAAIEKGVAALDHDLAIAGLRKIVPEYQRPDGPRLRLVAEVPAAE